MKTRPTVEAINRGIDEARTERRRSLPVQIFVYFVVKKGVKLNNSTRADVMDGLAALPDRTFPLIIADPPYGNVLLGPRPRKTEN